MENVAKALFNLEKRILGLEMFCGFSPDPELFIHPKSYNQLLKAREERDKLNLLRDEFNSYLFSHYDQNVQIILDTLTLAVLVVMANLNSTPTQKSNAQAKLAELAPIILPAWLWIHNVVRHFFDVHQQIKDTGVYIDPDFEQFDDSDPRISIKDLVDL